MLKIHSMLIWLHDVIDHHTFLFDKGSDLILVEAHHYSINPCIIPNLSFLKPSHAHANKGTMLSRITLYASLSSIISLFGCLHSQNNSSGAYSIALWISADACIIDLCIFFSIILL